jgi:hypothetical protein
LHVDVDGLIDGRWRVAAAVGTAGIVDIAIARGAVGGRRIIVIVTMSSSGTVDVGSFFSRNSSEEAGFVKRLHKLLLFRCFVET